MRIIRTRIEIHAGCNTLSALVLLLSSLFPLFLMNTFN